MSYAEAPSITVEKFIRTSSWKSEIDKRSLAAQLISVSRETKREPDPCYFEVENGILVDSITQNPILGEIKRETPLQEVEYQVALQIQDWAAQNKSGIAIWISPRNDLYPCDKISIHRIAYALDGKKVIQNSYILFDANFRNPGALRRFIFTEEDTKESIPGILEWIRKASNKNVNTDTRAQTRVMRQAIYFTDMIRSGVSAEIVVEKMRQIEFLGQNPISCPGSKQTFSNLLNSRAEGYILPGEEKGPTRFCSACEGFVDTYVIEGKIYCSLCGQYLGTL